MRELNREGLSCYSDKIESVSLRKQSQTFLRVFTYKMAAKISWHRYGTKLRYCHSMYSIRCGHCNIYSVVRLCLCLSAQGIITVLDGARIYH